MFEKVNPAHPDKIADRIAGAIVDLICFDDRGEYREDARAAVEVLIGHGKCQIIGEVSKPVNPWDVCSIVKRIAGIEEGGVDIRLTMQDKLLAENQREKMRCGDNGIFRGVPLSLEEKKLAEIAREIYKLRQADGKYIIDDDKLIICQSEVPTSIMRAFAVQFGMRELIVNPLGDWTGGLSVDTGATNRKLGSDMGRSVTGGGLHGKDLTKADVTLNIFANLKAQKTREEVELVCAIGDEDVDGIPYGDYFKTAKEYIKAVGGFEKFAEWGLI